MLGTGTMIHGGDEIVRRRVFARRARFNGEVAEGHLGGERTLALKPMTFMNEVEPRGRRSGALSQDPARPYRGVPR